MKFKIMLLVLCSLFLAGCADFEGWLDKLLPQHIDKFSREYIKLIKNGKVEKAISLLDKEVKTSETEWKFRNNIVNYIGNEKIVSIKPVNINVHRVETITTYSVTYQIQYAQGWQVVSVVLRESEKNISVLGFHANNIEKPLEEIHKITLKGKTTKHFAILGLTIFYNLFIIVSFIMVWLTRNLKRKWLWSIFTLIGICKILFNWTTAQFGIQFLSIGFVIATPCNPTPYTPWIINIYLPLGAIIFHIKRFKVKNNISPEVHNEESSSFS